MWLPHLNINYDNTSLSDIDMLEAFVSPRQQPKLVPASYSAISGKFGRPIFSWKLFGVQFSNQLIITANVNHCTFANQAYAFETHGNCS